MEKRVSFEEELQEKVLQIEAKIETYLPEETGFAKEMAEAINYSMLAGGKRLRPLLMQEAYTMFGGKDDVIYPFMAAIEMIHTHSLIHDDLPALDNDQYRRGKPTTHVKYGESAAILAGDALLNYAYETACLAFQETTSAQIVGAAISVLSKKTGIYGMLGGQGVDVKNEENLQSEDMLTYIYANKTSALIEASLMVGAILAGATTEQTQCMEKIGYDIGLAFQIQDDILDVTSTMDELGKPVGSDEKNHKTTYVTIKGKKEATLEVEELTKKAVENLCILPGEKTFLIKLFQSLCTRRK